MYSLFPTSMRNLNLKNSDFELIYVLDVKDNHSLFIVCFMQCLLSKELNESKLEDTYIKQEKKLIYIITTLQEKVI